jgi:hypothetical protein
VISPASAWAARRVSRAVSATDSLSGRSGAGRATRRGRAQARRRGVLPGQRRSRHRRRFRGRRRDQRRAGCRRQGVADGGLAELGQAASAVCRQVPSQVRAWDWSQPSTSFPVLNVSSSSRLAQGAAGSSLQDGTQPRVQARAHSADPQTPSTVNPATRNGDSRVAHGSCCPGYPCSCHAMPPRPACGAGHGSRYWLSHVR